MKKLLYLILILIAFKCDLKAQQQNCWYSYDYGWGKGEGKMKKVKGKKAMVCFNDHKVTMLTDELGLVEFYYTDEYQEFDSFENQIRFQKYSGTFGDWQYGEYICTILYNKMIEVEHTMNGNWYIFLWNPCHQIEGCFKIAKVKKTTKTKPILKPVEVAKTDTVQKIPEAKHSSEMLLNLIK